MGGMQTKTDPALALSELCIGACKLLYILCVEGDWRWQESHQRPDYTNWAGGEPNNVLNEDCAHISNKQWYDAECSSEDNFLQPIHALCQTQK